MQMPESIPEILQSFRRNGNIEPVHFTVTKEMVAQFSSVSGDRSHLHMSEDYARRSMYRQQVVHGMLPVAFVSLANIFHQNDYCCQVRQLNCQFIEPVFIGDELVLQGKVEEIDEETGLVKAAFSLCNIRKGTETITGSIQVAFIPASVVFPLESQQHVNNIEQATVDSKCSGIMECLLEEISVGDTDGFQFALSYQKLTAFKEILITGANNEKLSITDDLLSSFYLPDLLAIMFFSSSVGVYIPGKYATFLSFEAKVNNRVNIGNDYSLKGRVSHVSRGTRIIKKKIAVTDKAHPQDDPLIAGAVKVLVNQPPAVMPTMKELRETSLDYGLTGKIAVITGASRGIGETIAKFLALHGAKVVVNFFRGKDDAKRVVEEIISENGQAIAIQADVTDEDQVRQMMQQVIHEYGGPDILVNNAVRDFKSVPFNRLAWNDVQKDIDVVVKGAFYCCREALPYMTKKGAGKIINIGTVATDSPPANQVKYIIAKSGLVGLTRSLSVEYASKNIQVNMVVPSFIETDLVSHIPEVYRKKIAQNTPLGRNASPADVAQAVLFLASSYSSFTTGQKILVTGGGAPFT